MKNKKGFTLIELLAVIVILGLLMAIAIPSVTKYITESRKKTVVSTIGNYITAMVNEVNDLTYTLSLINPNFILVDKDGNDLGVQSPRMQAMVTTSGNVEKAKDVEEWEKLFKPVQLRYSVKKEGPITPAQKNHIKKLLDHHGLTLDRDMESMTKNEASRFIDKTINEYGRVKN